VVDLRTRPGEHDLISILSRQPDSSCPPSPEAIERVGYAYAQEGTSPAEVIHILGASAISLWETSLASWGLSPAGVSEYLEYHRPLLLAVEALLRGYAKGYEEAAKVLAARAEIAQEEERKRIARDIHDQADHAFATALFLVDMCGAQLPGSAGKAKDMLQDVRQSLLEGITELRTISRGLHPRILEDLGLVVALRQCGKAITAGEEVTSSVEVRGEERRLSPQIELALYRIAQEAISNARKHSGAGNIRVRVTYGEDKVSLLVRDDGSGFDLRELGKDLSLNHSGILNMKERAGMYGGRLRLVSRAGRGTKVRVEFPV